VIWVVFPRITVASSIASAIAWFPFASHHALRVLLRNERELIASAEDIMPDI
jgi:hypothetical protein